MIQHLQSANILSNLTIKDFLPSGTPNLNSSQNPCNVSTLIFPGDSPIYEGGLHQTRRLPTSFTGNISQTYFQQFPGERGWEVTGTT